MPRWSAPAWGAIGLTVGFVAVTAWWLAVDRAVPYGDTAQDLFVAFRVNTMLSQGELLAILDMPNYYPPAVFVLGGLAVFVGGADVGAAVLAQNLVFVPLLALACYRVGRMTQSPPAPRAGLLAVLFALGAPLLIEQFHVFMLDAPQAVFVAVAVWLVLESDRFRRVGIAALAGVAVGLGVETKELAPLYLPGLLAAVLVRGAGWRNWRGLLAFAVTAFAVGAPWYLRRLEKLDSLLAAAGGGGFVPPAASPSLLSSDNLLWYGWATVNNLLLAPLCVFAAIGIATAIARVARARPLDDPTLELLAGLLGAWLVLLVMPHHDLRYTMPLIIFIAVLGTAWIVRLRTTPQAVAIALLVVAVGAAHLGATFGVGGTTDRRLPGSRQATLGEGVPLRDRVVVYTNQNFLVAAPERRGGDLLGLFRALHDADVRAVHWLDHVDESSRVFERIGLLAYAEAARMQGDAGVVTEFRGLSSDEVVLIRDVRLDTAAPCMRLPDGTGVWVRRGDPAAPGARDFCPLRRPQVYGP